MGQEIVYCHRCQSRVVSADFDRGEAFRIEDRPTCGACAREILPSLPPKKQRGILNQAAAKKASPEATPRTPRRPLPSVPPRSALPAAAAVGAAALALVFAIVFMSGGSPPAPPPDVVPDRERAARSALDVARAADVDARAPLLEKVAGDYAGTPAAREARRDLDVLHERKRQAQADAGAALLERARSLAAAEDFGKALDLLRDERKRHLGEEWTAPIDARIRELDAAAASRLAELKEKAVAARKGGDEAAVAEAGRRAERWGASYAAELGRAVSEAIPPALPRKDGSLLLRVADATITGPKIKRFGEGDWAIVRNWFLPDDLIQWTALPRPGTYTIHVNYALPAEGGGELELSVGDVARTIPQPPSGGWGSFKEFPGGTVTITAAGPCRVTLRPLKVKRYIGTVRYVKLVPAK